MPKRWDDLRDDVFGAALWDISRGVGAWIGRLILGLLTGIFGGAILEQGKLLLGGILLGVTLAIALEFLLALLVLSWRRRHPAIAGTSSPSPSSPMVAPAFASQAPETILEGTPSEPSGTSSPAPVFFPTDPNLVQLRCVRSGGGYYENELAGFGRQDAQRLVASGAWVPVRQDLQSAARLIIAEYEEFKATYLDHEKRARARSSLSRAISRYHDAGAAFPIEQERAFHLRIYRRLAEAAEKEPLDSPTEIGGLMLYANPMAELIGWNREVESE